MEPQPDPYDQVEVRIDDDLVIWTPRGFEDEVRAAFAADPTLRDRLVDYERERGLSELKLIEHAETSTTKSGACESTPRTGEQLFAKLPTWKVRLSILSKAISTQPGMAPSPASARSGRRHVPASG